MDTYSQDHLLSTRVTVKYENVTVKELLQDLKKRYRINFSYSNDIVPLQERVNIEAVDKEIKLVLEKLFEETGVTFVKISDQIVLLYDPGIRKYKEPNINRVKTIIFEISEPRDNDSSLEKEVPKSPEETGMLPLVNQKKVVILATNKELPSTFNLPPPGWTLKKTKKYKLGLGLNSVYNHQDNEVGIGIYCAYNLYNNIYISADAARLSNLSIEQSGYDTDVSPLIFTGNIEYRFFFYKDFSLHLTGGYQLRYEKYISGISVTSYSLNGKQYHEKKTVTGHEYYHGFCPGVTLNYQFKFLTFSTGYQYNVNYTNGGEVFIRLLYNIAF
ncbi:MAG: STN domain-containing protein [Bacteroidota bacterium]